MDPSNRIGGKGYIGRDMITPLKKPLHHELLDSEKNFNKQVDAIRPAIERVIAHFRNWTTMHTDYRRSFPTFTNTISTVAALPLGHHLNEPHRWHTIHDRASRIALRRLASALDTPVSQRAGTHPACLKVDPNYNERGCDQYDWSNHGGEPTDGAKPREPSRHLAAYP